MFSGKDAVNPAYPTQWALNPTAYQNIDSSQVDWAALAQQWIAMKEAAAIVAAPPPPSMKPDVEEGEAPMEVENPENNADVTIPPGNDWNASGNNWGGSWNQWGWGWPGSGPADPKVAGSDSSLAMPTMVDGYSAAADVVTPMPGYSTGPVPAPTFQHGYWTAPQAEQASKNSSNRDRRSKSKNRDKMPRSQRQPREKTPLIPPVIEPLVMPAPVPTPTIDSAKRRQLPAWIREGLEKMEREKQKAIEREQEKKAREEAEQEKKRLEEEELARMKAEAGGQPMLPPKSKFDSDSESEESGKEAAGATIPPLIKEELPKQFPNKEEDVEEPPPLVRKSKEEIMQEVMLAVRHSLTEILLEVTDQEIHTVSQEELARYTAAQASRLNAMKASKSKALAAIASGLGLGAYESSSEESADEDELNDVSDQQLQDIIKRKRSEFERTSREIEAEVRRAEQRETGEEQSTLVSTTPDRPRRSRSSATPPVESETPEKLPERPSKDKKTSHKATDKVDGCRRLETIHEEKPKKVSKREYTPSLQTKSNDKINHKESSSSTSSDSEDDSSSSSNESSSDSEPEKVEVKKRKRKSSSSSDSGKKTKKQKVKLEKSDEKDLHTKSKYNDYDKSRSYKKKDDYYDKYKSSRRDYERERSHKYRDDSEDERPKKRSKRSSRSISYESRSGRRKSSRDRSEERPRRRDKKSYDRESSKRDRSHERSGRGYDKHDRYERSRDYERRRSRTRSGSYSRHRR